MHVFEVTVTLRELKPDSRACRSNACSIDIYMLTRQAPGPLQINGKRKISPATSSAMLQNLYLFRVVHVRSTML